jgi:hypothetical protein
MGFSYGNDNKYGRSEADENDSEDENEQQPPRDNRSTRMDRAIGSFVMRSLDALLQGYHRVRGSNKKGKRISWCDLFQLLLTVCMVFIGPLFVRYIMVYSISRDAVYFKAEDDESNAHTFGEGSSSSVAWSLVELLARIVLFLLAFILAWLFIHVYVTHLESELMKIMKIRWVIRVFLLLAYCWATVHSLVTEPRPYWLPVAEDDVSELDIYYPTEDALPLSADSMTLVLRVSDESDVVPIKTEVIKEANPISLHNYSSVLKPLGDTFRPSRPAQKINYLMSWMWNCIIPLTVDTVWSTFATPSPWDEVLTASRGGYCMAKAYFYLTGGKEPAKLKWLNPYWRAINECSFYGQLVMRAPRVIKNIPFSSISSIVTAPYKAISKAPSAVQKIVALATAAIRNLKTDLASDCPFWIHCKAAWIVWR